jgi:hypothetical protein
VFEKVAVPVTAIVFEKVAVPVTPTVVAKVAALRAAFPVTAIVFEKVAEPFTTAVVDTTRPAFTKKSLLAMSSLPSVWRFYYL